MSKLLTREIDSFTGVETRYHKEDGKLVVETQQDVEPYLEKNLRERNDGANAKGDFRKVASIPLVLINKWLHEDGINFYNRDHWPAVLRKLRSPEYAYLRTGGKF